VQFVGEYRVARTGEAGELHTRCPNPLALTIRQPMHSQPSNPLV